MASIPLALSIHNFINKVGSDAGFASIIGLAILVLLYFAQARETSTLRDHATDASERIQQLEARISQLVRAQAAADAAAPAAPAAARPLSMVSRPAGSIVASRGPGSAISSPAAAGGGVLTAVPAAPAGVGAPALTAATKLIPTPALAQPAMAPPATPAGLPPFGEIAPPPATVAGGGNGHPPEGVTTSEDIPSPVPAPFGPPQPPPPRVQIRPGQPAGPARRPVGMPRPAANAPTRPSRRILAAVLGMLLAAAVVIVLLVLTSSGGGTKAKTGSTAASNAPTRTRRGQAAAVNPATVTVAVLNGTATTNLAHRVSALLGGAGYKAGTNANAPDQTHTLTVVAYLPTFKRDALAVATSLKIPATSVQAIDPNTQAVACPAAPAACPANVVVTVGADLAGTQ